MIELGSFEWFMIVLDIICIVGLAWSIRFAKKIGYPTIQRDVAVPATLIAVFTIFLILWLLGVIHD